MLGELPIEICVAPLVTVLQRHTYTIKFQNCMPVSSRGLLRGQFDHLAPSAV
jgi:hypothetical protein